MVCFLCGAGLVAAGRRVRLARGEQLERRVRDQHFVRVQERTGYRPEFPAELTDKALRVRACSVFSVHCSE